MRGGGSTPITPVRYTVKIDKNNSDPYNRITYMHDAEGMSPAYMDYGAGNFGVFNYGDWGDVWFIKDNYPVMLKYDGTVDYKLDPNDYTKKEDGTSSDIANLSYNGNAMSRFPKVYLSFTEDTNYEYISVSNVKYDENYEAIGFINDNGNEVDEIFLSIYRGYKDTSSSPYKLRSISGKKPTGSNDATQEITLAAANGTGWYTRTWAQRQMVNALLTIISKSDNSQEAFGKGNYYSGSSSSYMSTSGNLNDHGQFFGYNNTTNQVKVFHIEDWWGNQWERIAGIIVDSDNWYGNIKVAMHGPYNIYGSGNNYNTVFTTSNVGNMISGYGANCKCDNTCGRLPISNKSPGGTSGTSSTFLCDYFCHRFSSGESFYPFVSGYCNIGAYAGAHHLYIYNNYAYANWYVGASLSYMSQS